MGKREPLVSGDDYPVRRALVSDNALRIATVNCLHGMNLEYSRATGMAPKPVDKTSLAALAQALRALDADVIALQEVDRGLERSAGIDQVAWLAANLEMHGAFAPALLGSPDSRWTPPGLLDGGGPAYGIGLLSRQALRDVQRLALPGGGAGSRPPISKRGQNGTNPGWDREPRVALIATVARVTVITTHLSYLPWRAVRQLRITAAASSQGRAAILLGDLNLPAPMVRAVLPGWRHAGGAPTYPAGSERLQVDHILTRGALEVTGLRVGACITSDHRPVIADVRLAHIDTKRHNY